MSLVGILSTVFVPFACRPLLIYYYYYSELSAKPELLRIIAKETSGGSVKGQAVEAFLQTTRGLEVWFSTFIEGLNLSSNEWEYSVTFDSKP